MDVPVDLTGPQIAAQFIKAVFGNNATEQPVHICSLGNDKDGKHPLKRLDTREGESIECFVEKLDVNGRATYFAVGTLKHAGDARNKEHIAEISFLHADIDFKDIDDSRADVERKLKALRYPPSNGIHAYWLLTESIVNPVETGEMDRIEADLLQLCDIVGGDAQVCEIARLMRLPGSHNSKGGAWKAVEIIHPADFDGETVLNRYELSDLKEWFSEQSPIILRKKRPRAATVGELDGFDEYLREIGYKPPVDVDVRLKAMMFKCEGDSGIHATQLAVSASMLNAGHDIDEVAEVLLAATKAAAGDYGKRWNWRVEERNIRKMCETWLNKLALEGKTPKPLSRVKAQGSQEIVSAAQVIDNGTITQDGVARIFAQRYAGRLRYCHHSGAWYEWTGSHCQKERRPWPSSSCANWAASSPTRPPPLRQMSRKCVA
jgi:hypothetical protein